MNRIKFIALVFIVSLALPAFAMGGKEAAKNEVPVVAVSILPEAYFVERIAGNTVFPLVLVGEGQSPHSYEVTPRQMAELSKAAVWFTIGVEFEKGLQKKIAALYPSMAIIDTTVGVTYRMLETHHHEGEEEQGEHAEEGPDPHIWLGRDAAKKIAFTMRDSLSKAFPENAKLYAQNCADFIRDIDKTFDGLKPVLAPLAGKAIFVYHPAFGYFFDEFDIEQEAVETGGKEPTQKTLTALINEAKDDGAKVIFVQAQFPQSQAKVVADAIGGTVVSIDPLARDWLANIQRMGEALTKAVR